MAKKILLISPVLVCAAVITALVLSGVGGAVSDATVAQIEQQRAKIVSLLEAGDMAGADTALDELLAVADCEQKGRVIHEIAGAYKKVKDFDKTLWLSQYVVDRWPGADYAMWCEMEVAWVNIHQGNEQAAQMAIDKLSADYASDVNQPWTLYILAEKYRWQKRYEKAKALYQEIIDGHAQSEWSSKASLGISRAEILGLLESKSYWPAEQEVKKLVADFSGNVELPGTLRDIAERYRWVKKYDEAEKLFKLADELEAGAGQEQPEPDVRAQCATILALLQKGKTDEGFEAIDGLIANSGGDTNVAEGLYWIAKEREWVLGLDDANSIYERILKDYPDSPQAERARLGIQRVKVGGLIEAGDLSAAEDGFDAMVADFNGHPDLRESLYWLAKRYEGRDEFEKAKSIYEQIIQRYPGTEYASKSELDIPLVRVFLLIRLGRHSEAMAALDRLIRDFEGSSYLAEMVFRTGQEYYYEPALRLQIRGLDEQAKDYFQKATTVWERSIQSFPFSIYSAQSYYYSGECYRRFGQYNKAVEYYQQVVNSWPDCRQAAIAQFSVGDCYEKLKEAGGLPESEANLKAEQAYKAVLEKYPESSAAGNAAEKLGWLNFTTGRWAEAAEYFELSLVKYPEDERPVHILYPLGRIYEEMGEFDRAVQVYEQFVKTVYADDPRIEKVKARLEGLSKER